MPRQFPLSAEEIFVWVRCQGGNPPWGIGGEFSQGQEEGNKEWEKWLTPNLKSVAFGEIRRGKTVFSQEKIAKRASGTPKETGVQEEKKKASSPKTSRRFAKEQGAQHGPAEGPKTAITPRL